MKYLNSIPTYYILNTLSLKVTLVNSVPAPRPESEPEPESLPEFNLLTSDHDSDHDPSQPFYRKYENVIQDFSNSDHVISVSKNTTNDDYNKLVDIIQQRNLQAMGRSFDDFVKMAFWAAVLSTGEDGHTFDDIHQVSLEESTDWWKNNFINHGCYCWPEQEKFMNEGKMEDAQRISGFGKPVDPLDEECFDLYSCYRCTSLMPECKHINWVTSHYDCQFISTMKNFDGTNTTRLEINCNDPDPCLQSLCECDRKFALNASEKLKLKDDTKGKIFPDGCPRVGHEDAPKKCCGTWPNVLPYPTDEKCCSAGNIFQLSDGVCSAEEIHLEPTWDQFYDNSTITLNMYNPNITEHDHNASHENADHIHPMSM